MPTRRNRNAVALLGAFASALAGCSLVLGLSDGVEPASLDASASSNPPPDALDAAIDAPPTSSEPPCVATAGWHLDCPFGGARGKLVPIPTTAPPILANGAQDSRLFLATSTGDAADASVAIGTLDAAGTYDTVSQLGTGFPSVFATTPFSAGLFTGDIVSLVAASTSGGTVQDETLFSQALAPELDLSLLPADLGPCVSTAGFEPVFTGFIINGAGSLTTSDDLFVMANRALDGGEIRPVLLHISGPPVSATRPLVSEIYPSGEEDAGDDDASADAAAITARLAPPLALFRCSAQVPLSLSVANVSLTAWMAGTASDGTGVAELFVDASSTSPPSRVALPIVPSSGMATPEYPGSSLFLGANDAGLGLVVLTIDSPNVHPATIIDTGTISIIGTYHAVLTATAVTAVAATAAGTLAFFQWTLHADPEAGLPAVTTSPDFGENGVLQIALPDAFDLGNIAAFDGDFFVSIRVRATGEARLLRLTNR